MTSEPKPASQPVLILPDNGAVLRMWILTTPSGFETFFSRCAAEFARPGGPDMPKVIGFSAEHGIHFVQEEATGS
jgi:hypothetical protein